MFLWNVTYFVNTEKKCNCHEHQQQQTQFVVSYVQQQQPNPSLNKQVVANTIYEVSEYMKTKYPDVQIYQINRSQEVEVAFSDCNTPKMVKPN
jgi:hypothetical protein